MEAGTLAEPILVGMAVLFFLFYHLYLIHRIRWQPLTTIIGQTQTSRLRWCRSVMKERRDILAVQAIRNSLMASSLLATASLTFVVVVTAYLANAEKIRGFGQIAVLSSHDIKSGYKIFSVLICFLISFFFFTQATRTNNHASFLITTPMEENFFLTPEYVWVLMNRGAIYYSIGVRSFYLAGIALLWLFGPVPALMTSIAVVCVLYHTDMCKHPHEASFKAEKNQFGTVLHSHEWTVIENV